MIHHFLTEISSRPRRHGLAAALLVFVLDQWSKHWALGAIDPYTSQEIAPFFNLVLVWNRGISFGILSEHGELARWLLAVMTSLILLVLLAWLRKIVLPHVALAVGLVIGGAAGNLVDRLRHGAVVDFLDFYIGNFHWPAFNVADSAICVGVTILVVDNLFLPQRR